MCHTHCFLQYDVNAHNQRLQNLSKCSCFQARSPRIQKTTHKELNSTKYYAIRSV
uniref:Uncharacterized protein n=1 Tax=Arundo donax TaxID=35708 RepID=A0A0A9BBV3_ARUDO